MMSAIQLTTMDNYSSIYHHIGTDNDEIRIFEYDKHEDQFDSDNDDNNDRFSPVIKDEEINPYDRSNTEQQFQNFIPYFMSPYYPSTSNVQTFDKMPSLECLSKFAPPSSASMSNSNIIIDQTTGVSNSMYSLPSPGSFQHWRIPVYSYEYPKTSLSTRRHFDRTNCQEQKQKKSHIKKPLNAFMLFMREQRAQVVQECTLRESAAINQILGRKWHELDRNVQQKYYDMARDERMKHMQLHPGWSARDNYGARKKRTSKGKKREKNQECLNQKKCRARFGLEQQANWCKHCKRKKKCLRYTENESTSVEISSWSDEDDTDQSEDCDVIPMIEQQVNSDDENKSRLLK